MEKKVKCKAEEESGGDHKRPLEPFLEFDFSQIRE
jgi:hypothetical protein